MDKLKRNQGIVSLKIGNKEVIKQNTITALGDAYFSAKSKQAIAALRAIEEGFDFIQSGLNTAAIYSTAPHVEIADESNNLTIYLLNLTQVELDALTAESTLLPIYTDTFDIDYSKVVGWASMDRVSAQAKQGIFSTRKSESILDDLMTSIAWEWAAGKTEGSSFNCIAIGYNLVNTSSNRFSGMSIFRGLEPNDVLAGEAVAGGFMLRPNVLNITGTNEIILGGRTSADYALGRVKYDMVSKTRTELKQGDSGYDFPLSKADQQQLIIGDRLFYLVTSDDGYAYIYYYDMVAGTHTNTLIYTRASNPKRLFSYNGNLYIYYSGTVMRAYNQNTFARNSSADLAIADLDLPADFYKTLSFANIAIGQSDSGYIISDTVNKSAMVRSELLESNSVVSIIPKIGSVVNYTINNEVVFFDYNTPDDLYQKLSLGSTRISAFGTYGVKYSRFNGNLLSFLKYTEPQTIASDDIITVEYAYKYGV